jgi:ankyrin repeat protein
MADHLDVDRATTEDRRSLLVAIHLDECLLDGLMCAIINNDMQMVKWLIALGASDCAFDPADDVFTYFSIDFDDIPFTPLDGTAYVTPTSMAIRLGHIDIFEYIVKNTTIDDLNFEYTIYVAIQKNSIRSLEIIFGDQSYDIDVKLRSVMGATPLIIAAENSSPECVTFFLNLRASKGAVDWDDRTALMAAVEAECIDILENYNPHGAVPSAEGGAGTAPAIAPAIAHAVENSSSSSDDEDED